MKNSERKAYCKLIKLIAEKKAKVYTSGNMDYLMLKLSESRTLLYDKETGAILVSQTDHNGKKSNFKYYFTNSEICYCFEKDLEQLLEEVECVK
jgi:hypothetical protein